MNKTLLIIPLFAALFFVGCGPSEERSTPERSNPPPAQGNRVQAPAADNARESATARQTGNVSEAATTRQTGSAGESAHAREAAIARQTGSVREAANANATNNVRETNSVGGTANTRGTNRYTFEQRNEFISTMQAQLTEQNRALDEITETVNKSSTTVQARARPEIAAIRAQIRQLEQQLDAASNATPTTWERVTTESEKAYDAVKDGLMQVRNWISDQANS